MSILYDANAQDSERSRGGRVFRAPAVPDLPDLYERPRRRIHPMLAASLAFIASGVLLYGGEAALPAEYKPSHFIGGYTGAVAEARAEGELSAKIVYDRKLKLIETGAQRWHEQCRAGLQNMTNLYQATYQKANMAFQLNGDLKKQYAATRNGVAAQTAGGEIGAANLGTALGYGLSFFDKELSEQAFAGAEKARQRALQIVDEAAKEGATIPVEAWDATLPDPYHMPKMIDCEVPASLAALTDAGSPR